MRAYCTVLLLPALGGVCITGEWMIRDEDIAWGDSLPAL